MTTEPFPPTLVLVDGAMAMDGGSLFLAGSDPKGVRVEFLLDRSIANQRAGTTQFYANGVIVPRRSPEEANWLALLREAAVPGASGSQTSERMALRKNYAVLADDAAEYIDAVKHGPESAIAHLAVRFVSLVSSADYQEGHAPPESHAPLETPPPRDRVRALLIEGKTTEALKLYREAHPGVGMMVAKSAVKAMATEIEHAAQPAAAADTATRRG